MLRQAFNALTRLHSKAATLKRLGSPDVSTAVRITPANFFRFIEGPSQTVIHGREYIIPLDSIVTPLAGGIKRGDRLVDPDIGVMTIDEVIDVYDLGAIPMGYRVRCE